MKDASKPPTQDNIKQIVEMKFPPDTLDMPDEELMLQDQASQ